MTWGSREAGEAGHGAGRAACRHALMRTIQVTGMVLKYSVYVSYLGQGGNLLANVC